MARPAGPVAKTAWTPVWHTWVLRARVFFRVCGQAGAAFRIQGELCLVSRNLAVPSVNYPLSNFCTVQQETAPNKRARSAMGDPDACATRD